MIRGHEHMSGSRRSFLRNFAAGAAAAAVIPAVSSLVAWADDAAPYSGPIRLNRNENAYGPSREAIAAMQQALADANHYPRDSCEELRDEIARLHGVQRQQVVLGCGSTEI